MKTSRLVPLPRRWRRALAGLVVLALAIAAPSAAAQQVPLNILLMNDDGIGAPGIKAMQAALEAAGDKVVVVAPDGNASGSSASTHLGEVFLIQTAGAPNEYKVLRTTEHQTALAVPVPATPVECLVLSRAVTPFVPDLVISGINNGANSGLVAFTSGTVAGASVASTRFSPFGGVPAIAVSLESAPTPFPPRAGFTQNYDQVADFVVDLIGRLQSHSQTGKLLPGGVFLNVNYPALAKSDIKGVEVTSQGDSVLFNSSAFPAPRAFQGFPLNPFNPSKSCDLSATGGYCLAAAIPVGNNETVLDADTSAVVDGYISISPFATDYTAGGALGGVVQWLQSFF
jgi:5'-nucleotidase